MSGIALRKHSEINMTEGNILRLIVSFTLPLLLGNIFQQLYNMVDTWVVGNYVGKVSFSAVGTLGPTTNILIGFFTGFSNGAGVIISQYFGARDEKKVSETVHTFATITLILCFVFTFAGLGLTPLLLKILKSPAEVEAQQRIYLTIYFAGVSGLLLYNMGAAILRAVGNSTVPFIFLVVCTLLNIVLDLVFVIQFKMGTAGVAYATILAQAISAVLVVILLFRTDSQVKIKLGKLKIDWQLTKRIFRVGFPAAIQMSITAFSNVFVQSYINFFGTDVMGGWTAYSKIDQIVFLGMSSIAISVTTFVGQNIGAGDIKRAKKGTMTGLYLSLGVTAVASIIVLSFARSAVVMFIGENELGVINYGVKFLWLCLPLQLTACCNQVFSGALRGCGRTELPMIVMLASFVGLRQVYLYIMSHYISNTPMTIAFSYPFGWIVCSILIIFAFIKFFPKEGSKQ